ncbi:MAG: glycoside hydrolase family 31 protein [Polyangiaceae bacterium]|nr:glycoside hydrolase family 31 protein [Polyangiaceae bacterium]
MRLRTLLLTAITALPLACGGEADTRSIAAEGGAGQGGSGGATAEDATLTAGPASLRVRTSPLTIELVHGDAVRLTLTAASLGIGTVDAPSDDENYDPYFMAIGNHLRDPDGLAFETPTAAQITARSAAEVSLSLTYPSGPATLSLARMADGRFRAKLTPAMASAAYLRVAPRVDAQEGLYGLGENFDSVDNRGRVRPMQIEGGASNEASYTLSHVPIPLVVGTTGWGLFVESRYPGVFDVCAAAPDVVEATFGTGLRSSDGLVFHLFSADHPLDITKHYHDVAGAPRLPARWALGPWLWRDENLDQAEVMSDIAKLRALDLPHTGLWIDRPYATGVNTFDWNKKQFPDAQAMIDEAHAMGLRMAIWHTPYIDEKDPSTKALLDEVKQKGYLPPKAGLSLNKWGTLIDLTNPDAYAWWQQHIRAYTAQGIEGMKLDYAEDVIPGLAGIRNPWRFADGSDERTMHSLYNILYHKVYAETLPEEGGFLLARHGTWGDQVWTSVIWPGDLDASFDVYGAKATSPTGEAYVAVGGLPASIIAGLSVGVSGYPFYGADTGGYLHSPPDDELFRRWFEQTAVSTVMQVGNGASTAVWDDFAKTGYNQQTLDSYRQYARLHLRLFPYEWTYAARLRADGRPIARPLGLAHPELRVHPDDVYLFGDDLLVAPVVTRGATTRTLHAPAGRWAHFFTGEIVQGGGEVTVDAPLGRLPLFLREGGIVPLLRPTIDAMAPTTRPEQVDSYATTPGVLWARAFVGPRATFTLFDGAVLTTEAVADGLALSSKDGAEFALGVVWEVVAVDAAPSAVTLDGAPLAAVSDTASAASGWAYDAGARVLSVRVPAGAHAVHVARLPRLGPW